jgi:two-component system nitrogen regulation response regulator GlnG/two-component system response regulator HydG
VPRPSYGKTARSTSNTLGAADMAHDETTASRAAPRPRSAARPRAALVVVFSRATPERVGEVALVDERTPWILGRGEPRADDPHPRLRFVQQRPGAKIAGPALEGDALSRRALRVEVRGGRLAIERIGKATATIDGAEVARGELAPGQVLFVGDELGLLATSRPDELRGLREASAGATPFGGPDPAGFVGESPAAWELRERLAFAGGSPDHVLVLGPSGVGKELAAQALHAASPRRDRPFISRNAATLPQSLADAELFGHAKNFPQAGMPERAGLVGAAEGGTLFLDELGEVTEDVQARLLRLLEGGGYHRLGDAGERRADVRVIAATNRDEASLKHDLLARFRARVELPGLEARPEDVPLLARHLLAQAARRDPRVAARFGREGGAPRCGPRLIEALVRHRYTHHVRELDLLLWSALAGCEGEELEPTPEVVRRLRLRGERSAPTEGLSAERVRDVLDRCGGSQEKAYRELGLSSRDALYRLLRKLGISAKSARPS